MLHSKSVSSSWQSVEFKLNEKNLFSWHAIVNLQSSRSEFISDFIRNLHDHTISMAKDKKWDQTRRNSSYTKYINVVKLCVWDDNEKMNIFFFTDIFNKKISFTFSHIERLSCAGFHFSWWT